MSARVVDNSRKVLDAAKKGMKKTLLSAAAYVRKVAQQSIAAPRKTTGAPKAPKLKKDGTPRKQKTPTYLIPSKPGNPPRSPKGRLRGAIAFDVNEMRGRAFIGPRRSAIALIGRTHEFSDTEPPKNAPRKAKSNPLRIGGGGPVRVVGGKPVYAPLKTSAQVTRAKALTAANHIPQSVKQVAPTKPRRYPARPFMGPALRRSAPKLPSFWRNSVHS